MANPTITNNGHNMYNEGLTGTLTNVPKYMALGSSALASPGLASTALQTEYTTGTWSGYARATATMSVVTVTNTNDTAKFVATFTAPASETPSEAGLFDATATGNMAFYGSFTGIPLSANDSLQLTFESTLN